MQGIETKEDRNTSFVITTEQSAEVSRRYEIAEVALNLRKALGIVGDLTISEAISELEKMTDFVYLPIRLDLENVPTVGNHGQGDRFPESSFSAVYVDDSCLSCLSPK